jgi:large subunit ribosomal protein L17
MAQSLFQYGQIETTLAKAKEIRPFVERLITLARKGTLQSRQRVIALLGDRSIIGKDEQEQYERLTDAQRRKVLVSRSGRRHRAGKVPPAYNKKKIPFVASSVVHRLFSEIAPGFQDRPGGYTRIIRLAKRRIGDNSDLAILQLVGEEDETPKGVKKSVGSRRQKTRDRTRWLEEGSGKRKGRETARSEPTASAKEEAAEEKQDAAPPEDEASAETGESDKSDAEET